MAVYLGNQLIGNGLYLGNENYRDSNVFMSMSSAPEVDPTLKLWLDAGLSTSYPGTGTTWFDISGNGNNLSLNGTLPYNSVTGSFAFNNNAANNASSSTATNLAVSASGANSLASFEVWLRLSGSAESTGNRYYCAFELGQWNLTGTNAVSFTDNGFGNGLCAQFGDNGGNTWIPTAAQSDNFTKANSKDIWRQVVFTRSGSVGTFYVDGLQDRQNSNYATSFTSNTNQLYIGRFNYGEPFFGDIAIAKYWVGKTLTAAEVSASFQEQKTRFAR
jgi:hypothetical protein